MTKAFFSSRKFLIAAMSFHMLAALLFHLDSDLLALIAPQRYVIAIASAAAAAILLFRMLAMRKKQQPAYQRVLNIVFLAASASLFPVAVSAEFLAYPMRTVSFTSEGVSLVGTVYLPDSPAPHPGVVLVHGSGKFPRRMYHVWADHFVRSGIAVMAYDKRGVGDSGGVYEGNNNTSFENLQLLAKDAAAAADFLTSLPGIDASRVGLWSISQGGWITPIAASLNPRISFVVNVSGPAVSVGEENYFSRLTGDDHGQANSLTREQIENLTMQRPASEFDPHPYLARMTVPSLWIYAGQDNSIPVRKSVARLDSMVREQKLPIEVVIYPGANHVLLQRSTFPLPLHFAPGFLDKTT